MARIERSRGGRFKVNNPNLQAGLKQEQIQQQRIIDSLRLQQKQSDARDAQQMKFMEKSDINEAQNRKLIQNLEDKKFQNRYDAVSKRGTREVENLRGQADEYRKESEFWQQFTPKLAKDLTTAAEGIYNFADKRYAEQEFAAMMENGEFDILRGIYAEENKLVDAGLVDKRFEAYQKGDIDLVDYLGNTRRRNSFYLSKLIEDEFKSNFDQYENQFISAAQQGSDPSELFKPENIRSSYNFRGQEIVRIAGLNPKSPAGLAIIKLWDDRGRSRAEELRLQQNLQITTDNKDQSLKLFLADPTQDNFTNFLIDVARVPSTDRNGAISPNIGSTNWRATYELAVQELVGNEKYAGTGGFAKFEEEVLDRLTPGEGSKQTWQQRHPALYEFAQEEYQKEQKLRREKEQDISDTNDANDIIQIDLDIENKTINLDDFSAGGDREKLEARTRTASAAVRTHIHDVLGYNPKIMDSFGQSELLRKAHRDGDFTGFMFTYRSLTDTQRREFDVFRKDLTDLQEAYGGDYVDDVRKKADEIIAHASGLNSISDRKHPTAFAAVDALEQSYYYHFNNLRDEENARIRSDKAWELAQKPVDDRLGMFRTQSAAEGTAGAGQEKTIWLQFSNTDEQSRGLSRGAIEAELYYNDKTPNDLISAGTIVDKKTLGRFALDINSGADNLLYPQSVRDLADLTGIPKRDIMNRVLEVNKYDQRIPADYTSVAMTPKYIKPRHAFANLVKDWYGDDIPVTPYVAAFRENLTGIDAIRFNYDESLGELDMSTIISSGRDYGVFYNAFTNSFIQR